MQKQLIGFIVVVLIIIGGYFILGGNNEVKNEEIGDISEEQSSGKKMAFSDFLKQGGAYKCEILQSMGDFTNNGTMYINGKTLRGEFSTVAEGRKMDSSFISRDGYAYTWSSMTPGMGFKIKTEESDTNYTEAWDASEVGDYNCENWVVDAGKFEIPKDINFQEIQTAN